MSKIWLLLLLVGTIQFVSSFPALDNEEYDLGDSFEYDLSGSDEERGEKWDNFKNKFRKMKQAVINTINKGRKYIKDKGVSVEPIKCEGGKQCSSCVTFLKMKKQFCLELKFFSKDKVKYVNVKLIRKRDDKEDKELLKPLDIAIGSRSTCVKLGSFFGKCCLQGVEGTVKAGHVNFCLAAVLKSYGVGAKFCLTHENGKTKMRIAPKMFPGDEEEGKVLEGGPKEDEAKDVDAEELIE